MADELVRSDPPCRLLVRTKTNVVVYNVPERQNETITEGSSLQLWQGSTTWSHCTPDGKFAFLLTAGQGVVQCNLTTCETVNLQETKSVQVVSLSPSGIYAVTWERQSESTPNNLKVFRDGQLLASFAQKSFKRDAWPSLQFTHDERYAFLLTTNEIRVYPIDNFSQAEPRYSDKIRVPGLSSFSLPPRCNKTIYLFTTFSAGSKDHPAKASLYDYRPNHSDGTSQLKMSKSLFQCDEMKTHWSPTGDAALITLQTSVDHSGQSYYGSSQLFLLSSISAGSSSSSTGDQVIAVPVKEAPVLDVAWMPHPSKPPCFATIAGKMPALASLHHGQTAQPLFLFGNAHRNTIVWSPHGRFLTLAGFGNLAGGVGFWDRNKLKLIPHSVANARGELKAANATTFGWSPDSRLFFTATCSPRMNVENGIRLWQYTGVELTYVPWNNTQFQPDQLLQAQFIPALLEAYPDRPQTPLRGVADQADIGSATQATATVPPPPPPSKPAAYVPPSARNRTAGRGTSLAERMRLEKEGSMQQATKIVPHQAAKTATGKVIPGLVPTTKSKNALKREKAKLKKQQDEVHVSHEQQDTPPSSASAVVDASKQQTQQKPADESSSVLDPEKRARKLKKTLKQIEDLKQQSVDTWNDDQKSKIASEARVRAELAELGF